MARTESQAYHIPGHLTIAFGNIALRTTRLIPRSLGRIYLGRQKFYQPCLNTDPENTQGDSRKKWEKIWAWVNLKGKTVLDIGCAEGFFCLEAVRSGATRVVGLDCEFRTLLCAELLARTEKVHPHYVMGVFPGKRFREPFDCVFCLSILHHRMVNADMWSVLTSPPEDRNRRVLRELNRCLRELVATGGQCVLEIPYEHNGKESAIDYAQFCAELVESGFESAEIIGGWEHAMRNQARKTRMLYVARA